MIDRQKMLRYGRKILLILIPLLLLKTCIIGAPEPDYYMREYDFNLNYDREKGKEYLYVPKGYVRSGGGGVLFYPIASGKDGGKDAHIILEIPLSAVGIKPVKNEASAEGKQHGLPPRYGYVTVTLSGPGPFTNLTLSKRDSTDCDDDVFYGRFGAKLCKNFFFYDGANVEVWYLDVYKDQSRAIINGVVDVLDSWRKSDPLQHVLPDSWTMRVLKSVWSGVNTLFYLPFFEDEKEPIVINPQSEVYQRRRHPSDPPLRIVSDDQIISGPLEIRGGSQGGSSLQDRAGGIFISAQNVHVNDIKVINNTANLGGAVLVNQGSKNVFFTDIEVANNLIYAQIGVQDGAVNLYSSDNINFTNVQFTSNHNYRGKHSLSAALLMHNSQNVTLTNVNFINNKCYAVIHKNSGVLSIRVDDGKTSLWNNNYCGDIPTERINHDTDPLWDRKERDPYYDVSGGAILSESPNSGIDIYVGKNAVLDMRNSLTINKGPFVINKNGPGVWKLGMKSRFYSDSSRRGGGNIDLNINEGEFAQDHDGCIEPETNGHYTLTINVKSGAVFSFTDESRFIKSHLNYNGCYAYGRVVVDFEPGSMLKMNISNKNSVNKNNIADYNGVSRKYFSYYVKSCDFNIKLNDMRYTYSRECRNTDNKDDFFVFIFTFRHPPAMEVFPGISPRAAEFLDHYTGGDPEVNAALDESTTDNRTEVTRKIEAILSKRGEFSFQN